MNEYWHGTANGYNNRKCRCDSCKAAWAEHTRKVKAQRAARVKDPKDLRHGTAAFYGNHGCRCASCKAAWNEAMSEDSRNRTARRKAA